jgi:adenosylmethionine---8-amino-7-oxononanoate aminotransferase
MHPLAELDHRHVWHPFTQMRDWLKSEPTIIVSGEGALLRDARNRQYLDANSSIWTNLHGHNHPKLNAALQHQLGKVAHSSALGLANEPASLLAQQLIAAANPRSSARPGNPSPTSKSSSNQRAVRPGSPALQAPDLQKVFFSDNGSTAVEVALKLAYEFARRVRGFRRPKFLSLDRAYHGDTVGAVSLGHIDLFHKAYAGLLFQSDKVMAPYCYRCRFNRAKPTRADAREDRICQWECVAKVEKKFAVQSKGGEPYAAMVVEPLMQGAAGMIPQPAGWLARISQIVRSYGAHLIADEVMTGFGRTGAPVPQSPNSETKVRSRGKRTSDQSLLSLSSASLFACHHEGVQPDFLALAKGLTGGYLPMAATLTTKDVFNAFLGEYEEFKTFFHGHSYSANQLGAATALASLEILHSAESVLARQELEKTLSEELKPLWTCAHVGDIRQVGLIVGVELVRQWRTREPFDLRKRIGIRVCEAMAKRGVLTRPIGNVVVLMPPYCTTPAQARQMVTALKESVKEICGA